MAGAELRFGPAAGMEIKNDEGNGEGKHRTEKREARQAAVAQKMPCREQAERENEGEAKL